jgi:hypothetical protein
MRGAFSYNNTLTDNQRVAYLAWVLAMDERFDVQFLHSECDNDAAEHSRKNKQGTRSTYENKRSKQVGIF